MISLANLDLGSALSSVGQLAKDIRVAITGREPISADRAAEIALKVQALEASLEQTRVSVMLAEASSQDKWTSRARPAFLYNFYFILLALVIFAPLFGVFFPEEMKQFYVNVTAGFGAIPKALWWTFSAGYLGYTGARQYGKLKGTDK